MNVKLLELHREQLRLAFYRIATIKLNDARLDYVRNTIGILSYEFEKIDFSLENTGELYLFRDCISLLQEWTGWIANQEQGTKPHAVINCMDIAASEWIGNSAQFILVATDGEFGIYADDPSVELLLDWIYNRFKIDIPYKLVHIQIPFHLDDDYLFNICLYHELGHFIDDQLKVTEGMAVDIIASWSTRNPTAGISGKNVWELNTTIFQRHLKEIFADIFAAQYVGKKLIEYIDFMCEDVMSHVGSHHPAPRLRKEMIMDVLRNSADNEIIENMNSALYGQTGKRILLKEQTDGVILTAGDVIYSPIENIYQVFTATWDTYIHHTKNIGENAENSYQKTCRAAEMAINNSIMSHTQQANVI